MADRYYSGQELGRRVETPSPGAAARATAAVARLREASQRRAGAEAGFVDSLEALLARESGDPAWARQFARYTASVVARRAGKDAAADMILRNLPPIR